MPALHSYFLAVGWGAFCFAAGAVVFSGCDRTLGWLCVVFGACTFGACVFG
jgi:hypothetical protein